MKTARFSKKAIGTTKQVSARTLSNAANELTDNLENLSLEEILERGSAQTELLKEMLERDSSMCSTRHWVLTE